jgi:K+ transporter
MEEHQDPAVLTWYTVLIQDLLLTYFGADATLLQMREPFYPTLY